MKLEFDEIEAWRQYAAAALSGFIAHSGTIWAVPESAAKAADEMIKQERERFPKVPKEGPYR